LRDNYRCNYLLKTDVLRPDEIVGELKQFIWWNVDK
jgi:hypothetical protein